MLCAELACYWARVGEFTEAERLCRELRQAFGDGRDIRVSILIMCVEGLLFYFKELRLQAYDRIARARLLSIASSDKILTALTSAWLAHIYFNDNKFIEMADSIRICFNSMTSDNIPAACRISLLLGDIFLYVGNTKSSRLWYDRSRDLAIKLGDQASIGALTYNRAALRVFRARIESISGLIANDEIKLLNGEVQSAINYQSVANLQSLAHLLDSAHVGVLLLQNRFRDAVTVIEKIIYSGEVKDTSAQVFMLKADLAFCYAKMGIHASALEGIEFYKRIAFDQFEPDDRIIILNSIQHAHLLCNSIDHENIYTEMIKSALKLHIANCSTINNLIHDYETIKLAEV